MLWIVVKSPGFEIGIIDLESNVPNQIEQELNGKALLRLHL